MEGQKKSHWSRIKTGVQVAASSGHESKQFNHRTHYAGSLDKESFRKEKRISRWIHDENKINQSKIMTETEAKKAILKAGLKMS